MPPDRKKLGLIAGNGRFPFLVLDAARAQGFDVVVAAIKEEAFPEIASRGAMAVHWLSLGELSRLIETFRKEGVSRAVMAGQVKHKQIFSSIRPDWRLAKLLLKEPELLLQSLMALLCGVFVVLSIFWGWRVDGLAPDRYDLIGGAICLIGVFFIMYWPR